MGGGTWGRGHSNSEGLHLGLDGAPFRSGLPVLKVRPTRGALNCILGESILASLGRMGLSRGCRGHWMGPSEGWHVPLSHHFLDPPMVSVPDGV